MRVESQLPAPGALSLRANFSWTLAGNLTFAACQWGMITLLVKLGDPAVVGRLSYGLAVTAPLFMFSNLQLRALQSTQTGGSLRFSDFAAVRVLTTALAVLAASLAAWVGGYGAELAWVVVGLGIARAVDALSDVIHGDLQRRERMDLLAGSLILRGLISVGALAGVYALGGRLVPAVWGMAAGNLLVFLFFDLPRLIAVSRPPPGARERGELRRAISGHRGSEDLRSSSLRAEGSPRPRGSGERALRGRSGVVSQLLPRWRWKAARRILRDALPLGAVMMLISLNTNIPRYFIQSSLGDYALGIFTPLAQLVIAGALVVNALGQSATPRLARLYAAGDLPGFRRLVGIMLAIAIALMLGGLLLCWLAGAALLTWIYSAEYAAYVPLLAWFVALAGLQFAGSFVGYAMTAAKRYRVQLPLFLLVGLVCLGASAALVPRFGLDGAVYALMVSALVQLAGSAWILLDALGSRMKIATAKR